MNSQGNDNLKGERFVSPLSLCLFERKSKKEEGMKYLGVVGRPRRKIRDLKF